MTRPDPGGQGQTPRPVVIALDLLGGDAGPEVVADAALAVLQRTSDVDLVLVGPASTVAPLAQNRGLLASPFDGRVRVMDAPGEIAMTDDAVAAVRSRTDTSVHGAVTAVREGTADAWVSIGHTGAVLTAATLTLGRLHGVTRAAVAVVIPGTAHDVVLLDVGGSLDVSAEVLAQFGDLGRAYAIALGLNASPRVGLLSIGTEPGKGDALRKEADALLRTADVGYVGFVEGRDIAAGGPADVIVVDGFTGNVVLKALEGAAINVAHALAKVTGEKEAASVVAANYLSGSKAGAVLLGVNGITVLGHGGSTADEVGACIDLAVRLARHDLVGRTRQLLSGGS